MLGVIVVSLKGGIGRRSFLPVGYFKGWGKGNAWEKFADRKPEERHCWMVL